MRYPRCAVLGLVLWVISMAACASYRPVTVEEYVAEFLTLGRSKIAPKGWYYQDDERLMADSELFLRLREVDPRVLAVAVLNAGIHPRWTIVFLQEGKGVRFVATYTFWGMIQTKITGITAVATVDTVRERLTSVVQCSPALDSFSMMRGWVYFEGDEMIACDVDPFEEGGALLTELIDPLLDQGTILYTIWEE